jgi:hypothetical protein
VGSRVIDIAFEERKVRIIFLHEMRNKRKIFIIISPLQKLVNVVG